VFRTVPHNINTEQNGTRPARPANILHTALHSAPRYGTVQYRDCHVRRKVVRRHPESQGLLFCGATCDDSETVLRRWLRGATELEGTMWGEKKGSVRRCWVTRVTVTAAVLQYCARVLQFVRSPYEASAPQQPQNVSGCDEPLIYPKALPYCMGGTNHLS
jgi:hypothetical protein